MQNTKKYYKYKIIFLSFHKKRLLTFCNLISHLFKQLNEYSKNSMKVSGPIGIPQKIYKLCVIKSPFVYKKSQELFEIRTFKQIFIIKSTFFEKRMLDTFFIKLIEKTPPGIDIKIKVET